MDPNENGRRQCNPNTSDDPEFNVGTPENNNGPTELEEKKDEEETETEEAYRLRVYGTADTYGEERKPQLSKKTSFRRVSERVSRQLSRQRSSVVESLPETPTGWVVLISALSSALLGYEIQLQKTLTCPPTVFGQVGSDSPLKSIYDKMTANPDSILLRPIQPSLFVGTRSVLSSSAAFLLGGPASTDQHIRFRQILTMTQDGAKLALDWELPPPTTTTTSQQTTKTRQERINEIQDGPIQEPVVLILHGINNDASFGYIRSTMRACSDKGWVAVGMNFRGCGGVPLATPRGYNGAYTGDIRCIVHHIAGRLADGVPIFLVGNSLGANLVTKYLGEEGLSGTLPECVAGGVALGNPLSMQSSKIDLLLSPLMALGAKKNILENFSSIFKMKDPTFRSAIRKALMAVTLADFDEALAPVFVRNEPIYPFAFRVGFKNGQAYWTDASSFRLIRFISVPMLQLIAGDDFLVYGPFKTRFTYSLANPNVMVIETKCGGHLGWQESPPDGNVFDVGTSWADVATTDFIEAAIESYRTKRVAKDYEADRKNWVQSNSIVNNREDVATEAPRLRSKL